MARLDAQALRHDAHDVGLRDRLAEPDRERVVAVRPGAQGLRDEEVTGNLPHRLENPGIVDAARHDVAQNHLAAQVLLPAGQPGRGRRAATLDS